MAKPLVLVIGDSISMGYAPILQELLADRADIVHNPGNAADSRNLLANLESYLAGLAPAVITFNCGLHDIKLSRETGKLQVPHDEYPRNFEAIAARLAATAARVMWVTTTPVHEANHTANKPFDRFSRDIDACNAAAAAIVARRGFAVCDLHVAALAGPLDEILLPDGVHFTEPGYRLLAGVVLEKLRALL